MKIMGALCVILLCAGFAGAAELQVFAAASLMDVMKEIANHYEQQSGTRLFFNFAASSVLARQIAEGSGADLFFSADEEKMDWLQKKGFLLNDTRKSLLSNSLVMVIPDDSSASIQDPYILAKSNWKIALAEPKSVPAGIYAKEYLEHLGIWSKIIDRVIPTENVRAALAAVESGNVDVGIVYKTDAEISKRVKVAYEVPRKDCPKISYVLAVVRDSRNIDEAKRFAVYLSSSGAREIFKKYGFIVP
jgi:molybdate transport system substrate-binding protein